MVESQDAGEVLKVFFNNHMVIWFQGEFVVAWLRGGMQVKSWKCFSIVMWSFGCKVNS